MTHDRRPGNATHAKIHATDARNRHIWKSPDAPHLRCATAVRDRTPDPQPPSIALAGRWFALTTQ
eukprot:6761439-Alexandrium_andersonii.AAC.1